MAAVFPVLDRIVDQVLEKLNQLIAVADDRGQVRRSLEFERDVVDLGERAERRERLAHDRLQRDRARRPYMLVQLDASEREQILDQPPHTPGLHAHDVEEAVSGLWVVAGVALQRIDETGDGGQRRAQFVAGICDEVGTHLFTALDGGEIVQQQRRHFGLYLRACRIGCVIALHRHRHGEFYGGFLAVSEVRAMASSTEGVRRSEEMCLFSQSTPTTVRIALLAKITRPVPSSSMSGSGRCSNTSRTRGASAMRPAEEAAPGAASGERASAEREGDGGGQQRSRRRWRAARAQRCRARE